MATGAGRASHSPSSAGSHLTARESCSARAPWTARGGRDPPGRCGDAVDRHAGLLPQLPQPARDLLVEGTLGRALAHLLRHGVEALGDGPSRRLLRHVVLLVFLPRLLLVRVRDRREPLPQVARDDELTLEGGSDLLLRHPRPREFGGRVLSLGPEPLAQSREGRLDLGRVGRSRPEPHGVLVLQVLVDQRVEHAGAKPLRGLSGLGSEGRDHHRLADLALRNRGVVDRGGDAVDDLRRAPARRRARTPRSQGTVAARRESYRRLRAIFPSP